MTISTPFSFSDASRRGDEFHQQNASAGNESNPLQKQKKLIHVSVNNGDTSSSPSYLGWAWLPEHLLDLIIDKLVSLYDYIAFKIVCKTWHSVAQDNNNKKRRFFIDSSPPQPPLLLIPVKGSEERRLYNVIRNKISDFRVKVPLVRCCGSCRGWLFILEDTRRLTLLNPFCNNKTISLPPIPQGDEDFSDIFVKKAVISKDPLLYPNDYEVGIIYDGQRQLAVYQETTKTWTRFPAHPKLAPLRDIIHYNASLYVSDRYMGVGKVDYSFGINKPQLSVKVPRTLGRHVKPYNLVDTFLVETSTRELLLILRILYSEDFPDPGDENGNLKDAFTIEFKIFKILTELSETEKTIATYLRIKDIGDNALFLGYSDSLMVSTREFPGLQRNSIYYTNDRVDAYNPSDAGIYNLENDSQTKHYVPEHDKELVPTTWIVPTLQGDWE